MTELDKFPDILKSNDAIFHYTKNNTAIKYILHDKKLRLTPRGKSIDPVENMELRKGFKAGVPGIMYVDESKIYKLLYELDQMKNRVKQICFCKNSINNCREFEEFGFLKPRMWDQYADSYRGLCLSFSMKEVINGNNLIHKNIDYITYETLKKINKLHVDVDRYEKEGEPYKDYCKQELINVLFKKHSDYNLENEYRFISISDSEYEYIDITKSITGIIVSELELSDFDMSILLQYSKELDIPIIFIAWKSYGILFRTLEDIKDTKIIVEDIERNEA